MKTQTMILGGFAIAFISGCTSPAPSPAKHDIPVPPPKIESSKAPTETTPAKTENDASLQGTWTGMELTPGHTDEEVVWLTFTENRMEYQGDDNQDWLKGTYVINEQVEPHQCIATVTESAAEGIIGAKCYIIYKIEDGTLTISGNPPGNDHFPASFNADGAREFVLKRE